MRGGCLPRQKWVDEVFRWWTWNWILSWGKHWCQRRLNFTFLRIEADLLAENLFGTWTGEEFAFVQSKWDVVTYARMLWQYGLDPYFLESIRFSSYLSLISRANVFRYQWELATSIRSKWNTMVERWLIFWSVLTLIGSRWIKLQVQHAILVPTNHVRLFCERERIQEVFYWRDCGRLVFLLLKFLWQYPGITHGIYQKRTTELNALAGTISIVGSGAELHSIPCGNQRVRARKFLFLDYWRCNRFLKVLPRPPARRFTLKLKWQRSVITCDLSTHLLPFWKTLFWKVSRCLWPRRRDLWWCYYRYSVG